VKKITDLREFHPKTILLWLFLWQEVFIAIRFLKHLNRQKGKLL